MQSQSHPWLIPWLRQQAPYAGPWPRPGAVPFSADAWFTNADSRLRPRSAIPLLEGSRGFYFLPDHDKLIVTPYNFPQLHRLFNDMLARAGVGPYQLVIEKHYSGRAHIESGSRTIGISLDQLNVNDFNSIRFLLGHEIGHAWQYSHPQHQRIPIREPRIDAQHSFEAEADVFARCLAGNSESIARGLRLMGSSNGNDTHPATALRERAIRNALPTDCLGFGPITIPPYLRARPARQ